MPAAKDTSRQQVPPLADTRQRLAAAALDLFSEKGFAATSVREISGCVGLTVPALYYHFGSKDGLLEALVEQLIEDGERAIADLSSLPFDPGRALARYYDVVSAHLLVFRLVVADPSVRSHEGAGHRLADQGNRFLELLTGGSSDRDAVVRANASLGALRRPLRVESFDATADRSQILASAMAALLAET